MNKDNTKRFVVAGNPILHSKSPVIFNRWFAALGIDAGYGRMLAYDARQVIQLFQGMRLSGISVTSPFKRDIMPLLDHVHDAARVIGGVNTVVREGERLVGYNTDHAGVLGALRARGVSVAGKKCVVLGAGGAGRAAVYGLRQETHDITVVNRTFAKAEQVARDLGCKAERIEALERLLGESDLFVSTLSAAIDLIPSQWLKKELIVFDANYIRSPLGEHALANGCTLLKGEEWLMHQALPAFKLFFPHETRTPPDVTPQLRAELPLKKHVAFVGFMGCGKTTVGRLLAQRLNVPFIDLDHEIENRTRKTIPQIFEQEGEPVFRRYEKEVLKACIHQPRPVVFGCGGGLVTDPENIEILKKEALVLWLYVSPREALRRIPAGTRPLLEHPDPVKTATEILNTRLSAYAQAADLVVPGETQPDTLVETIYEQIKH